MKREIKFRVWSYFDKVFHYWDVYGEYPSGVYGGLSEPEQYTGLKDKNGSEVYEGDIIEHIYFDKGKKYKLKQVIEFDFVQAADDADCDSYGYHINPMWDDKFEVIGNIHENADLLK